MQRLPPKFSKWENIVRKIGDVESYKAARVFTLHTLFVKCVSLVFNPSLSYVLRACTTTALIRLPYENIKI